MSLVNDMLNDLDKRRNQPSRDALNVDWLAGQKKSNSDYGSRRWMLAISLSAALILVAVIARLYKPGDIPVAVESVAAVATEQLLESIPVINRQIISAVKFSQEKTATMVNFEYADDIEYSVTREPSGLQIIFFDVQQQIDPKALNFPAPIKSISTQNQANVALVSLVIEGEFNYSQQSLAGQGLELAISATVKKPPVVLQQSDMKKSTARTVPRQAVANSSTNQLKKTLPVNLKQQDRQVANNARRLIGANQLAQAEQALQSMLDKQPLALHCGETLSMLLLAEQRVEEADILLKRLRGEFPAHIGLITMQARLLLLRKDTAAAVELLMSARPRVDKEPAYYELLGLAARQNEQYLLSEQAYKGLLNVDAGQGDWWVGLAIAFDAQGELSKARNAYQQALKTLRVSPALESYARQRLSN